jgi:hypothetical protein
MNDPAFDAFTRHAAGGISRRTSLLTLGGAGVAAALGGPLAAEAKKNKRDNKKFKRKIKKAQNKKCQQQVGQCQAIVAAQQPGNAAAFACCDFLGTCDFAGLVVCLNAANNPMT